ncbi:MULTISPECIES: hypothetical protein [unclassified Enterococcus]|uniref:hypothetical protein n=2 Tax=Enterococcus TaxID=1350 RepID=UPI001A9C0A66|nr:hypothetical protein [Enterococcus sp. DIV1271a]MBO1301338.1 hypothetical protein [Enterococcus sp. DIV1271a]
MTNNNRSQAAVSRLLGNKNKQPAKPKELEHSELNKKTISALIKDQGSSSRTADSIRINPILMAALKYWTTIAESEKSKPDVIEEAILKTIPEEYLIEGYKLAKKQNKI